MKSELNLIRKSELILMIMNILCHRYLLLPTLPNWVVDWNALCKGGLAATVSGHLYCIMLTWVYPTFLRG